MNQQKMTLEEFWSRLDKSFRIWTTPIGGETSGDFVQNPDVYLSPTVQDDGSFTGTKKKEIDGSGKIAIGTALFCVIRKGRKRRRELIMIRGALH